jgi:predicted RNA-binding Zn-ribbon protein involved in translation (DUF1610 family)
MPKCPSCGREIKELRARMTDSGRMYVDEDGEVVCEWLSEIYGDEQLGFEFECPECEEVIFTDYVEAEAFLEELTDEDSEDVEDED